MSANHYDHKELDQEDDSSTSTLTKHLHQEWKRLVDPDVSPEDRMAQAERLRPSLSETDAFISLKGPTKGLLPALDWNSSFRKAYSLLMWVRPRLTEETVEYSAEESAEMEQRRVLYRFSSNADDSKAVGVCVALSGWQTSADKSSVETTLTAYALPHFKPGAAMSASMSNYSSFVQVNLSLKIGEWQLLGINHTFPYLKRPIWSVAIDGMVLGQGELTYPVCENRSEMEDNQVLHNIVVGGAEQEHVPDKTDDQKSASELNSKPPPTRFALEMDVASLALYPDPISTSIQAVVAEAGPNLSLQKGGRVLPTLPPVPNWSKGSSMEGPKVGIPLTVHSAALDLQRLSGKFIFGISALSARVLGQVGSSQRLVCPLSLVAGSTESTPRVGLVRPAEPIRISEEDLPVLYLIGNTSLFHAVSDYLLNVPEAADFSNENLDETTKNLSVALQEQNVLSLLVMPFFLALCPPGKLYEMQRRLYVGSIRHLYALYSNEGAFAAQLILMLADYLRTGGARVHEEALQGGILHILAACLRLSLLRCQRVKFFRDPPASFDVLKKRFDSLASEEVYPQNRQEGTSPSHVPAPIADAIVQLLEACCGRTTNDMDELSPAMQIRRTSDSALTSVFGLALDLDLWGGDAAAASRVVGFVAQRYGGTSFTSGYILRSQVSVQYFLDCIRLRYDGSTASPAVEETALQFSFILQSMLLSSLSNRRSISQGEHDISACMAALTDSPLGSVGSHVVLNAIIGVLAWCEVLPAEMSQTVDEPGMDDERKMHLASRLGRNLLMAQFHDTIAPMILSRTVFSGERTLSVSKTINLNSTYEGSLTWRDHWQLILLLFSWSASIAGAEGLIAAKSAGSLLLAASCAGSLNGALAGSSENLFNGLFLPPPAIALMIGSTIRDEWSYTDLLSDRLQIMMPLVPGMVISLISALSEQNEVDASISALRELLRAVGGTFHRVFGGMIHSTGGARRHVKNSRDGFADNIKAAKTYVPHLLAVAMALEDCIVNSFADVKDAPRGGTRVMRPQTSNEDVRRTDLESWVDLSTESVVSEVNLDSPSQGSSGRASIKKVLRSCQHGALNTAAGLSTNAMNLGGAGASVPLWNSVLAAFKDSTSYVCDSFTASEETTSGSEESSREGERTILAGTLAQNVLCRLVSTVLIKSLKREFQWEVWNFELSSAVSGLVTLVEEKGLLQVRKEQETFSADQIVLISALLDVLEYGRDATGWCQLALPAMSSTNEAKTANPMGDLSESSKLLLPVLQPCLRILLDLVGEIFAAETVVIPGGAPLQSKEITETSNDEEFNLLGRLLKEFESTLTAAIVGLSFSSARDIALNSMATMRKAMLKFEEAGEVDSSSKCRDLLCKVAEELRQRYKAERQLRETNLFDAYENREENGAGKAAEESIAVERLLLGGDVAGTQQSIEEIHFTGEKRASSVSEDFVLFHENQSEKTNDAQNSSARLGFAQYEGLGAALEESTMVHKNKSDSVIAALTPYLDAWDEISKKDEEESELVDLFDTSMGLGADAKPELNARASGEETDQPRALVVQGSETAADAMSTFFEFAAAEKSRLRELSFRFLPSARYSRISYADRFCWARFTETHDLNQADVWERGVPDGNRDMRSRIPTVPFSPQFRRHIPKYLDHASGGAELSEELDDQSKATSEGAKRRSTVAPAELDEFTKTLLETGNLEIVDIMKQELEDDGPDLDLESRDANLDDHDDEFDIVATAESVGESEPNKAADDNKNDDSTSGQKTEDETMQTDQDAETGDYTFSPDELGTKMSHHSITSSAFATPPDNASSSLGLMHSAAAGMIEMHLDNCLHVRPEGSRQCAMLLTSTHLILEYDAENEGFYDGELLAVQEEVDRQQRIADDSGGKDSGIEDLFHQKTERRQREVAAMRPKSIRWNLSEVSHVYLRRYRLRDSSIELFFIPSGGTAFGGPGMFSPSCSVFLDFGAGREGMRRRNEAAYAMMKRAPPQAIKQWPDRAVQFLHDHITKLTVAWVEGRVTNFDYLLHLNILSGRSYNDICQYPVMPWVLGDYTSEEIPDLTDKKNFRDLSKPVGALNPERLEEFLERFETFADPSIPPFMYGSHYSTSAGVVLHFLVRLHPFAGLHRQLQSGHFDVADRLFSSVPRTWGMCTGQSAAEVKELTPEWYCNPAFLRNSNKFKLGTSQDGDVLGDVELPPWANNSPEKFVEVMRAALESDVCSEMLPDWIDLIFGRKQQGPEAIKANNVFFYLTYYGSVDVAAIEDEGLRQATELQIAHFGQCPMQLFRRAHVRRLPRHLIRPHFFQLISLYAQAQKEEAQEASTEDEESSSSALAKKPSASGMNAMFGEPVFLPFFSAPLSHWIHLDAPPPGPHADLVSVRLAGVDRCLAVDSKGIFHTFRWAWRNEEPEEGENEDESIFPRDFGCFIAQRELPRFRSVPRLMHSPVANERLAIAISKTLFAGRSVLLVLSAGDARGGFGMQLVDPAKGMIRGEVLVPSVHSARITCISTDPIGTAAGQGGVGGELAVVGSADGNASLWRFMSSHYLPLRPRNRLSGHSGSCIHAVGLCSAIHVAVTVSHDRCCIHSVGNGTLLRSFAPPKNSLDFPDALEVETKFAETQAVAISVQGYIVTVCETKVKHGPDSHRTVTTLHLSNMEGVTLGSQPLESWRGLPNRMSVTPDGTIVFVCTGRGVTMHRLSAVNPLQYVDEWQIAELDDVLSGNVPGCYDMDLGPSLSRPVCAAAACSDGVLRLHALPGISAFSERHRKGSLSQTVGTAFAKPAKRFNRAFKEGLGFGSKIADMGRDIGKEVQSDVKEKGVGGFLGSMLFRKNTQ